jgi:hypothetical protein
MDLGTAKYISCAHISWYKGDSRRASFTLSAALRSITDATQIFSGESSGITNDLETYSFDPVFARYLILTVNGNTENNWASVNEIDVMSSDVCTQTSTVFSVHASVEQDRHPATQSVDGDLTTRWSGFGKGAELVLDMGSSGSISCARIAWYRGDVRQNQFTISIASGSDLTDITSVYQGHSSGVTTDFETYSFTPVTGRYLVLRVDGNTENDWASVSDIAVRSEQVDNVVFRHPGILVTDEQLEFIKNKVLDHEAPWRLMYDRAVNSRFGSPSYNASPRSVVECKSNNHIDLGCTEEMDDAIAAYTQALLWYLSGDSAYAERSIAIMNAWSSTITAHTGNNAALQTGWAASVWPRAAEIIRYTYTGWNTDDIERFKSMLTEVYLPEVQNGWWGGNNWDLTMIEATMAIAVFTDDQDLYDHAIEMWKGSVPAYIYLERDGSLPLRPRIGNFTDSELLGLWKNPPQLASGMTMETCRDQGHTAMGLAAITNVAETALIQGVDLYSIEADRIILAAEFNTQFLNGSAVPSWLCDGTVKEQGFGAQVTYEILYNHYSNRLGIPLENTSEWIQNKQIGQYNAMLHMDWEILTHRDVSSAGNTDLDQNFCSVFPSLPSTMPTRTNTGVPNGTTLIPSGSITADTAGQVIDGRDITGGVTVTANNVTIQNSRILGTTGWWVIDIAEGVTGTKIINNEIYTSNGGYTAIAGADITVCGNYIHGFENAISIYGGSMIQANYIDRLAGMQGEDPHFDGIEIYNGLGDGTTRVWGNNILMTNAADEWLSDTGAINLTAEFGDINGAELNGNWIGGGSYTIYVDEHGFEATNVSVTNNRWYGTTPIGYAAFGPVSYNRRESITEWSGNVWDGDGSSINY